MTIVRCGGFGWLAVTGSPCWVTRNHRLLGLGDERSWLALLDGQRGFILDLLGVEHVVVLAHAGLARFRLVAGSVGLVLAAVVVLLFVAG